MDYNDEYEMICMCRPNHETKQNTFDIKTEENINIDESEDEFNNNDSFTTEEDIYDFDNDHINWGDKDK